MTSDELDDLIGELADRIDGQTEGAGDWRGVWDQIKTIGANFKGIRYESKDAHQAAWTNYQRLVERVKKRTECGVCKPQEFCRKVRKAQK